jgi:hypothetical protein
VSTGDGSSIRVISDQTEIRIGDSVIVEETGSTANVRRMTPSECESASAKAREELHGSFQQEAAECHNAKQQLVNAKTADEVDIARRKWRFFVATRLGGAQQQERLLLQTSVVPPSTAMI